ncbi:PD-(D/E)XK nuclease-like domain-containing protein [Rhodoferax sp. 4810]|uniref:PD-(D/E)XK nuclease-like domain-containing protein n=1 Tax=Thiospirillum jenense TaxID=1653858 RepID=A0A839HGV9_9GAMM|nr:PD-(D/E)XK nuclease-like domain-containing protein [Thiospirillum jenense]MBB1074514.1 PD-(D/E)XK nuclease-like domain-containing protein [Rhodoferax jenense]MBB1125502.1 PD-(D/E)XK nuclease-like domain-containing protein [Thiospirillum jenense]
MQLSRHYRECLFVMNDYRAIDAVNVHSLMLFERSPAHYMYGKTHPNESTPAKQLGTLIHLAVLELPEYNRRVVVAPAIDKRTKEGKALFSAFNDSLLPDSLVVTQAQHEIVSDIRTELNKNTYAQILLNSGESEVTLTWTDDDTGLRCKARPDWLCNNLDVIVDLKTANDASAASFAKSAAKYKYHMQAAFYLDALKACGLGDRAFIHIVTETEPPYGVALYQLDDDAIERGRERYKTAMRKLKHCMKTKDFPSYPMEIQPLSLPPWC